MSQKSSASQPTSSVPSAPTPDRKVTRCRPTRQEKQDAGHRAPISKRSSLSHQPERNNTLAGFSDHNTIF
jgi:hypothetical protein